MVFNSLAYAAFLPLAVVLCFLAPARRRWAVLLALSCLFYAWADPRLLLLLGALSSCLLFFASLAAGHTLSRHKLLASLGIFLALGLASQLLTMLLTLATGYRLSAFVSIPSLGRLAQFGHSLLIGGIVLNAAYCILLYAATAYLLGRRLDLE